MIQRSIKLSNNHSFFLFGPRGVGKTTLLKEHYSEKGTLFIDLLDIEFFDQLVLDPSRFKALIHLPENKHKRVVVDEVQKFPKLLDVVHAEIQKTKRQFILTGSSSRKLKQKGVNLLAGRAWLYHLFPLTRSELGELFVLKKALERGSLPDAYLAASNLELKEYLNAYVGTYMQKEIQQEQWVKNIEPFRRFLAVAAQMNGRIVNKSLIARDVGVNDVTVSNYFEILEDTLLGFYLPAFHTSVRKAQKLSPKFFFIDTGIKRALERTITVDLVPQTYAWGEAFEHWFILEIKKNASYRRLDWEYSFLRTKDDLEIDLIIDRPGKKRLLIEIKSASQVYESDAKTLNTLGVDCDPKAEYWLVSGDPLERKFGRVRTLHWEAGLKELFE